MRTTLPSLANLKHTIGAQPEEPRGGPPQYIYLTSHNTAIARASLPGEPSLLPRISAWFASVAVQPDYPVLVELDKNMPGVGAVQDCKTLSHLNDAVMPHEQLIGNLAILSTKCKLVVLFDFKNPFKPTAKTKSCQAEWRELLTNAGIQYQERTSLAKPTKCDGDTCQFFSMDTKKNGQCFTIDTQLEDRHRKTYNAGDAPTLSPLFAVWNCESDCLAHDAWNLQGVRDCLVRALHTTRRQELSGQETDYARVRVRVTVNPPTEIAFLEYGREEPLPFVTMVLTGDHTFETAASFSVVAVKQGSRWRACRVFNDEAVEEPIAASHFVLGGYEVEDVTEEADGVRHVDFSADPVDLDAQDRRISKRLSRAITRRSSTRTPRSSRASTVQSQASLAGESPF